MKYVLRYVADTPLVDRKHDQTLGKWDTWADADDARRLRPNRDVLEVVER